MRLLPASLLCSLVFAGAGALRADLVIQQHVDGGGQQGAMVLKIKGGKARADLAQPVSVITDTGTGDTIVLSHNRKTYTRIPAARAKALAEQLLKARNASEPPKLEATGKKETVSGHETEIFNWSVGTLKMKFWVAKDYPNGAALQRQLDQLQMGGLSSVAASMMPKASALPGLRLRTELDLPNTKVTYTIVSIKEESVDDAAFEPPKEYTELAAPADDNPGE